MIGEVALSTLLECSLGLFRLPTNLMYEQKTGGREWESNPPRTGLQPFPDLKSGRPTRDASLPCDRAPVARMERSAIRGRSRGSPRGFPRIALRFIRATTPPSTPQDLPRTRLRL